MPGKGAELALEKAEKAVVLHQVYIGFFRTCMSAETANEGFYVTTERYLGLVPTEMPASMSD